VTAAGDRNSWKELVCQSMVSDLQQWRRKNDDMKFI